MSYRRESGLFAPVMSDLAMSDLFRLTRITQTHDPFSHKCLHQPDMDHVATFVTIPVSTRIRQSECSLDGATLGSQVHALSSGVFLRSNPRTIVGRLYVKARHICGHQPVSGVSGRAERGVE